MAALFGIVSLIGFLVFFVLLIVGLIRKKNVLQYLGGVVLCFIILIVCITRSSDSNDEIVEEPNDTVAVVEKIDENEEVEDIEYNEIQSLFLSIGSETSADEIDKATKDMSLYINKFDSFVLDDKSFTLVVGTTEESVSKRYSGGELIEIEFNENGKIIYLEYSIGQTESMYGLVRVYHQFIYDESSANNFPNADVFGSVGKGTEQYPVYDSVEEALKDLISNKKK